MAHEEGRIRGLYNHATNPNAITGFAYDYFIKDHLGNIRIVLTTETKQNVYPAATLEGSYNTDGSPNALFKEKDYYTIDTTRIADTTGITGLTTYQNNNGVPVNPNPNSVVTANSAKLYKLNSTTNKTGLGITLKVMAGDTIHIFGKSYYFQNNTGGTGANSAIPMMDILTGLLGGPTGGTVAATHGGITASDLNNVTGTTGGINSLLTNQTDDAATAPTVPKAYINYIFFDDQLQVVKDANDNVAAGFDKVGGNATLTSHTITGKIALKSGYAYIYVSNESPVNVFFDNLQVIHARGPILEETHYYPFGLTMAGISSKALNNAPENKYRYNKGSEFQNKEFADGSGLELYSTQFRMLDPQIGRWWQIDPKPDMAQSLYSAMSNNPIRFNDPLGDTTQPIFSASFWLGFASTAANNARVSYIKEVSKIDKSSPTAKEQRVAAKEKARANTPEPFNTIVEQGRPIEGERAKINDPKINNPAKTNAQVNEIAATTGALGKGLLIVGASNSVMNIATSANPAQQTVNEAGSWGGAITFGEVGAQLGGSLAGPAGAIIGGFLASIVGGFLGEKYAEKVSSTPKLNDETRAVLRNAGATDQDIERMLRTD